ncbi:helix-turn-helix domain-containing protein [Halocynthiibacter styelae]|uniref:Helix-turn-helix transcriptional regulator n=1 Tax=Halocynthiibacter styelae TaxID=2761955 RepID=A0A8J7LQF0_9RHOB|nr:XRE family transcriptional regulator [Paenihalocynthiibacter styelae]MBI1495041.1 helix-turn-helix transcriptional regulator [Paenihalocynthiibacter styelae]
MSTESDILNLLPLRLKEARRKQGLSLDAVARLSGVSRSMVSQIERGESSPTIATLWNLVSALQIDFAGLLEDGGEAGRIEVLRADQTPTIENRGEGCNIRILSAPEDAGRQELYDLEFRDGGKLDSAAHARGTREHLTVIEGRLRITAGAMSDEISAGDTARYPADDAHCIQALGGVARALLVVQNG